MIDRKHIGQEAEKQAMRKPEGKLPAVAAVRIRNTCSRWTPGHRGYQDRGRSRRLARLIRKAEHVGLHRALKVELTYSRYDEDGKERQAGEWFDRARIKRHVGEFVRRLRKSAKSRRKIEFYKCTEFQQDGFVHFHLILLGVRFIPHHELTALWGWGFVWVRPLDKEGMAYVTKGLCYVSKGPGEDLPEYMAERSSATRLSTTSRHFFLDGQEVKADPQHDPVRRTFPSIGQVRAQPDKYSRSHIELVLSDGTTRIRTIPHRDTEQLTNTLWALGFDPTSGAAKGGTWYLSQVTRPASSAAGSARPADGRPLPAEETGTALSLDSSSYCGSGRIDPWSLLKLLRDS